MSPKQQVTVYNLKGEMIGIVVRPPGGKLWPDIERLIQETFDCDATDICEREEDDMICVDGEPVAYAK